MPCSTRRDEILFGGVDLGRSMVAKGEGEQPVQCGSVLPRSTSLLGSPLTVQMLVL